jgi:hypothetical protein
VGDPALVPIVVLDRPASVPRSRCLLDGFAFLCPDTVPHGKFCRNHECGNSKFYYRLPGDPVERKARACRFVPVPGMEITVLSAELKAVLAPFLGGVAPALDDRSPDVDEEPDMPEPIWR